MPGGSCNGARSPADGAGRMRRTVGIEVAATAVVLGLSAVLVQVNPARSATVDERRGAAENGRVADAHLPAVHAAVQHLPGATSAKQHGPRVRLHAERRRRCRPRNGRSAPGFSAKGIEPFDTPLLPLVPRHHAAGAVTFPLAGDYEVAFTVRIGEIDQATVKTTISVPSGTTTR